jgi:hypothetical protein
MFDLTTICIKLKFIITPLVIEPLPVAHTAWCDGLCSEDSIMNLFKPTVIGKPEFKSAWTENYGFLYSDEENNRDNSVDTDRVSGRTLWGALMLQTRNSQKDVGEMNQNVLYFAVNFPVYVYICRVRSDNGPNNELLPPWIKDEGYTLNGTFSTKGCGSDPDCTFSCFAKYHPGTVRNRWGGVESGAIRLKANVVEGVEEYRKNYIVAVLPLFDIEVTETVEIVYEASVWNYLVNQDMIVCLI